MIGVFAALDALLFYVFFEAMLIPMFIIIGIWGGPRRVYATLKFFLYTFLGSLLMLVALIYLYNAVAAASRSCDWYERAAVADASRSCSSSRSCSRSRSRCRCGRCTPGCRTRTSRRRPAARSILAAIMLKIGGYGFLRFILPITARRQRSTLAWLMIALSLIAVVYIGFVALVQDDMKKLIAYSSIAHMGFVTLGFFLLQRTLRRIDGRGSARGAWCR